MMILSSRRRTNNNNNNNKVSLLLVATVTYIVMTTFVVITAAATTTTTTETQQHRDEDTSSNSSASASSASSVTRNSMEDNTNEHRRVGDGMDNIEESLLLIDNIKDKVPPKRQRYMVHCKGDEGDSSSTSLEQCKEDFLHNVSGSPIKIVNEMEHTNMFAIEMEIEQTIELRKQLHIDYLEDDTPRFLFQQQHQHHLLPDESSLEEDEQIMINHPHHHQRQQRQLGQQVQYGVSNVNAAAVWDSYKDIVGEDAAKGSRAKVCVIDTGIKASHNDLDDERLTGSYLSNLVWDEDYVGHGTHVAGIVGASDNNEGVVGVSPAVQLHIVSVFNSDGIWASNLIAAMRECANQGSNVITMSLGGERPNRSERAVITELFDSGIVVVAAAGNAGNAANPVEYPAAYENVLSVAAADSDKNIAIFSSFNEYVSLAGPGVGITSLGRSNNDAYTSLSGTSMACPHVAGVAALMFSIFENVSSQEVFDALQNSAQGLGQCGQNEKFGHGHVDAKAAADLLNSGTVTLPQVTCEAAEVTITPDEYGSETTWVVVNPLGVPIAGGGPYENGDQDSKVTRLSLPELPEGECYTFSIYDKGGDGLCCEFGDGSYEVKFKDTIVSSEPRPNGFSGSVESKEFGCGTAPGAICGNGVVEGSEECDDGNQNNNDECSNQCTIIIPRSICGNGIVEDGEECDDKNSNNNDGCSNLCTINIAPPVCGNGVVEGNEACDDGNTVNGDGCSAACLTEDIGADCPNGFQKIFLDLETDRWSRGENEMYLFNAFDENFRDDWIWDYPYGTFPNSVSINLEACLDPFACYYFEFYDDYRDGLSSRDSNGLVLYTDENMVLLEIEPDEIGTYSFGRAWFLYFGNFCAGDRI